MEEAGETRRFGPSHSATQSEPLSLPGEPQHSLQLCGQFYGLSSRSLGGSGLEVGETQPHPTPGGLEQDKDTLCGGSLSWVGGAQVWCGKPVPQWDPCVPTLCPQMGCKVHPATHH